MEDRVPQILPLPGPAYTPTQESAVRPPAAPPLPVRQGRTVARVHARLDTDGDGLGDGPDQHRRLRGLPGRPSLARRPYRRHRIRHAGSGLGARPRNAGPALHLRPPPAQSAIPPPEGHAPALSPHEPDRPQLPQSRHARRAPRRAHAPRTRRRSAVAPRLRRLRRTSCGQGLSGDARSPPPPQAGEVDRRVFAPRRRGLRAFARMPQRHRPASTSNSHFPTPTPRSTTCENAPACRTKKNTGDRSPGFPRFQVRPV